MPDNGYNAFVTNLVCEAATGLVFDKAPGLHTTKQPLGRNAVTFPTDISCRSATSHRLMGFHTLDNSKTQSSVQPCTRREHIFTSSIVTLDAEAEIAIDIPIVTVALKKLRNSSMFSKRIVSGSGEPSFPINNCSTGRGI
ncbi:unnamed protein product [Sphagnum tenellum]